MEYSYDYKKLPSFETIEDAEIIDIPLSQFIGAHDILQEITGIYLKEIYDPITTLLQVAEKEGLSFTISGNKIINEKSEMKKFKDKMIFNPQKPLTPESFAKKYKNS